MYIDDTGNYVEETTDETMIPDNETADDAQEKPIENKCFMIWRDDEKKVLQALTISQKGQLLDLLCKLAFYDEDTELSTIKNVGVRLAYSIMGEKVRDKKEKYLASIPKKRESGSKGGKATASKEFVPPTADDVKKYCKETKKYIDVDAFMRQYTESNWTDKDGKPVKNWKNLVSGWHKRKPLFKMDFLIAIRDLKEISIDGVGYQVDSDRNVYRNGRCVGTLSDSGKHIWQ